MLQRKRVFKPFSKTVPGTVLTRRVDRWEWTHGGGLMVVYKDGFKIKSEYTLPELLGSEKPEGAIVEVIENAAL